MTSRTVETEAVAGGYQLVVVTREPMTIYSPAEFKPERILSDAGRSRILHRLAYAIGASLGAVVNLDGARRILSEGDSLSPNLELLGGAAIVASMWHFWRNYEGRLNTIVTHFRNR